ncbi:MAG: efflux RND transporter periplasmic adaptor subunit [Telmatospirillum sp.]|nr:efflux RND transporter periplasmic adaptor subunit [Telmatospirillum sp.]
MRVITQLAIIAVLGAVGGGGWYYYQNMSSQAVAAAPAARPQAPAIGVEFVKPKRQAVVEKVEAVGTARANESVVVAAKQAGNIARINFQEGQSVRAGAVLVELESRERAADTEAVRAEIAQSRALADEIRQQLDRARALRQSGNATEARVDQLESQLRAAEGRVRQNESRLRAADARFEDFRITAPFEGRVGMRQVSLGALLQAGTPITTLDDVRVIKIEFSVPEQYLGQVRVGLPVTGLAPAFAGREFKGEVTAIDTRIDPATRAVRLNASFDNSDGTLKPGMFLTIALSVATRDNAIVVPEDALLAEGVRQFLYVVVDGRAQRREIKLGMRMQGEVEVLSGIGADDSVIVRGLQRVRPNLPVNARPFSPPAS